MANRFVLNETSYHGKGAIEEIANEIVARRFRKTFVCSDPDLIKFNVTGKVLNVLDKAKIPYEVYSDIKPNPTIENVKNGVEAFKNSKADCIVAVGFHRLHTRDTVTGHIEHRDGNGTTVLFEDARHADLAAD